MNKTREFDGSHRVFNKVRKERQTFMLHFYVAYVMIEM